MQRRPTRHGEAARDEQGAASMGDLLSQAQQRGLRPRWSGTRCRIGRREATTCLREGTRPALDSGGIEGGAGGVLLTRGCAGTKRTRRTAAACWGASGSLGKEKGMLGAMEEEGGREGRWGIGRRERKRRARGRVRWGEGEGNERVSLAAGWRRGRGRERCRSARVRLGLGGRPSRDGGLRLGRPASGP